MLTVACIKWGAKYGPEWVTRLASMCARHLPAHEFVCFTERPVEGIECRPLPSDLPGWWAKVGLFRSGVCSGPTLYLDLDVVVTAPVVLPEPGEHLWTLDDFSYSLRAPKAGIGADTRRLLGGVGTVNSSVMYWDAADVCAVWDRFYPGVMQELHGDQNWITRVLWPDRIRFLDGVANSYKYHVLRGQKPAPIVVFHGDPKPDQVQAQWIRDNWR